MRTEKPILDATPNYQQGDAHPCPRSRSLFANVYIPD
jgi:hypothetical protein